MTSIIDLNGGPITDRDLIDQSSPLARALASAANYRELARVNVAARERLGRDVVAMTRRISELRRERDEAVKTRDRALTDLLIAEGRIGALLQLVYDLGRWMSAAPARSRAQRGIAGHIQNIPTELWTQFQAVYQLAVQGKMDRNGEAQ